MKAVNSSPTPTILQRIAKSDRSAINDCLNLYGNFVWRAVRKSISKDENIETAVENIFKDIWRFAKRFEATELTEKDFILMLVRYRLRQEQTH